MSHWPWSLLGIERTSDTGEIRRAYAARLKELNLDQEVQAYAELRSARDSALSLAASAEQDDDLGLGGWHDEDGDWDEDDAFPDRPVTTDAEDDAEEDVDEWAIPSVDRIGPLGEQPDRSRNQADPDDDQWTTPSADTPDDPAGDDIDESADDPVTAETPPASWDIFFQALFPNGQHSDEGMDGETYAAAAAAFDSILAETEESDITRQATIESNIADALARAWPRSGPFVMQADEMFHWDREQGALHERPSVAFLNARIQGMRIYEALQQESHPYHKEWVELTRNGKPTLAERLRIQRPRVQKLIVTIREKYPELEHFLDDYRVNYWEGSAGGEGDGKSFGFGIVFWIVAIVMLARCASFADRNSDPPIPEIDVSMQQSSAQLDEDIKHSFGADYTVAQMTQSDVKFMADFLARSRSLDPTDDRQSLVRQRMVAARETADFETLVRIQEQRAAWLSSVQGQDAEICWPILDSSFRPTTAGSLGEPDEGERKLARDLLEKGLLSNTVTTEDRRLPLPDWLVSDARKASGLSEEAFQRSLTNPEGANRCLVVQSLLKNALKAPGRVPIETLRGL